jgi:uncharacterized protein
MFNRFLDLKSLIEDSSLFLLGPRQTGKTTLLKALFPNAYFINLLESDTYKDLSLNPELIRQRLRIMPDASLVIIDEIQKLPVLLNEVHNLIELNKNLRFILTGSSARRLKQHNVNLLGGRVWMTHLFPLIAPELKLNDFERRIAIGGLPPVLTSKKPNEVIKSYIGMYLQEEIKAEGLVRSIERFSRFLDVAGLSNGEEINYTLVSQDCGVPQRTVVEYFHILKDTLLIHEVPSFKKKMSRRAVATSKYYFFDVGIANALLKRKDIQKGSAEYGKALEHLIFLELKAYLSYKRIDRQISYWRTHSGLEVDFLIDDEIAIEVKASTRIHTSHEKNLLKLKKDLPHIKAIIISHEEHNRITDNETSIYGIDSFLRALWAGEIIQ